MAIQDNIDTPLALACRKVGGQSALARLIGKHQTTVFERIRDLKDLWAEDVLVVEAATGISRHELRPDIYPPETSPHPPAIPQVDAAPDGERDLPSGAAPPSNPLESRKP